MAECIQTGTPFLGMPTVKSQVFFLELDMTLVGLKLRWQNMGYRPSFAVATDEVTFNCLEFLKTYTDDRHQRIMNELIKVREEIKPEFVMVDALREIYPGDFNISGPSRQLYDAFRLIFPSTTVGFVHHEKKINLDYVDTISQLNRASGSKELINNSSVVLQLINRKGHLYLEHLKSQITRLVDPIHLDINGSKVVAVDEQRTMVVAEALRGWNGKMADFDKMMSGQLGYSVRLIEAIRARLKK